MNDKTNSTQVSYDTIVAKTTLLEHEQKTHDCVGAHSDNAITKQEFINKLTNYLLSEVSILIGSSKEEQVQFLSEVQASVHSDKVKKVYRRRWFRDLPDPNEHPDIVDSILIMNRISWDNDLDWSDKIWFPLHDMQYDLKDSVDPTNFVYTDRILTYWLDKYANEYPENFKR